MSSNSSIGSTPNSPHPSNVAGAEWLDTKALDEDPQYKEYALARIGGTTSAKSLDDYLTLRGPADSPPSPVPAQPARKASASAFHRKAAPGVPALAKPTVAPAQSEFVPDVERYRTDFAYQEFVVARMAHATQALTLEEYQREIGIASPVLECKPVDRKPLRKQTQNDPGASAVPSSPQNKAVPSMSADQGPLAIDMARFASDPAYRNEVNAKLTAVASAPNPALNTQAPTIDVPAYGHQAADPNTGRRQQLHVPVTYNLNDGYVTVNNSAQIMARNYNRRVNALNHRDDVTKQMAGGDRFATFDMYRVWNGKHNMPIFTARMRDVGLTREEFEADIERFKTAATNKKFDKSAKIVMNVFSFGVGGSVAEEHRCMGAVREAMNMRNRELFRERKPWQWNLDFVDGIPKTWEGSLFFSPVD